MCWNENVNSPVAKCPRLKGLCLLGRLKEIIIKKEIIIPPPKNVTCFLRICDLVDVIFCIFGNPTYKT